MLGSFAISTKVSAGLNGAPYNAAYEFIFETKFAAPKRSTHLKGPPVNGGNPRPNTAPTSPSSGLANIFSSRHKTASLTNLEN